MIGVVVDEADADAADGRLANALAPEERGGNAPLPLLFFLLLLLLIPSFINVNFFELFHVPHLLACLAKVGLDNLFLLLLLLPVLSSGLPILDGVGPDVDDDAAARTGFVGEYNFSRQNRFLNQTRP